MRLTLTTDESAPTHGATRNYQSELALAQTIAGQHPASLVAAPLTWARTVPVSDRYCGECVMWVRASGFAATFACPQCDILWDEVDEKLRNTEEIRYTPHQIHG